MRLIDDGTGEELLLFNEKQTGYCHADRDGDCIHKQCPQLRDNEPHKTGRHCPLDTEELA